MWRQTHTPLHSIGMLFMQREGCYTKCVCVHACMCAHTVRVSVSQLLFVFVATEGQCHGSAQGTEHRSNPENLRNLSRRQGTNRV